MIDLFETRRRELNYKYIHGEIYSLMERAGKGVAQFIEENIPDRKRILIVCGSGNNCGDSLVAGEELRKMNHDVKAVFIKGKESLHSDESVRALSNYKGEIDDISKLDEDIRWCNLVIDGIFGTGITGEIKDPYKRIINNINASGKDILSVDVPSGLGTATQVKPQYTVTMMDLKPGMSEENSGKIVVKDIGVDEKCIVYSGPGDMLYLNPPKPDSHKGMNGEIGIIAGWEYYGSAIIAAKAAMSFGVDLVFMFPIREKVELISTYSPYYIVREYDPEKSFETIRKLNAVLIGPGMGKSDRSFNVIKAVLSKFNGPIVIDSDAIKLLGSQPDLIKGKKTIITPHQQEFRDISGFEPDEANMKFFSSEYNTITVLKGQIDKITDGNTVWYTQGGNARMTMGGTGDALAGLITAIVAHGVGLVEASRIGTFIMKAASDMSFKSKGYWYSLDDLLNMIPQVMMQHSAWK